MHYKKEIFQEYGIEEMPWIVCGGSYAGALSAWFRSLYPGLVNMAWASSAVIEAEVTLPKFD